MFSNRKHTEIEKRLIKRLSEVVQTNKELANQNAHLVHNSKRWANKFADPRYSVPRKIIQKMENETREYKQRTRAEIDKLRAQIAVLNERLLCMTEKEYTDHFGRPSGHNEVSFELASDHIASVPLDEDRKAVSLELEKGWQMRLNKFDKGSKSSSIDCE